MNNFTNIRRLLINEISLEGLDGITLQALWLRIADETKTKLPYPEPLQAQYWNTICQIQDFSFYELNEPRPNLVLYDRFKYIDCDIEEKEEDIPDDIYVHKPIDDVLNGIRGSCLSYFTRKNITSEVRLSSYQEVKERWGSKLVIVANQDCRNSALFGTQPPSFFELSIMQYCILERIGRSRYQGEITQGNRSLQVVGEDPKSLFYHRKTLLKHKLITKQVYHHKVGGQNFSGSLLHLHRYYNERKSKTLILTEQIVDILRTKPNHWALYSDVTQLIGTAKKLFKSPEFQRFVKTDVRVPLREFDPKSNPAQWKLKNFDREKTVRVMQLINPDIDVAEHWYKMEEYDDDDEDSAYQNYGNLCYGIPLLSQAAAIVRKHEGNGCSQSELAEIMGQNKLSARSFCRNLIRRNVVNCVMNDVGRQRVTRIVSRKFENKGQMKLQFKFELDKMVNLLANKDSNASSNDAIITMNDENSVQSTIKSEPVLHDSESMAQEETNIQDNTISEVSSLESLTQVSENVQSYEEINLKKRPLAEDEISRESVNKKQKLEMSPEEKDKNIDNIEVNLIVAKSVPGLRGYSQGLSEQLKHGMLNSVSDNSKVTYRLLKRANFIIEAVQQEKVIADLTKLIKMIQEEERNEGYKSKFDKKSLIRLVLKLAKDGRLKYIRVTLRGGKKVKSMNFICHPDINEDHSVIQSAIAQAKMKFYITHTSKPISALDSEHSTLFKINKGNSKTKMEYKYSRNAARKYGYCPKFIRMRIVHQLLYYLIYDEIGEPISDPNQIRQWLIHKELPVDEELINEMSPIYNPKEINWKTFIPPLLPHVGWPEGWTMICDLLLRLPLVIFVQCFNVPYEIPELEPIIKHPVRKFLLVRNLTPKIRNALMFQRKYIFSMYDILCQLCYAGLVQFGPQKLKEKDQVFFYLNRKTSLLNTVPSQPGYHEISTMDYEKHMYAFDNFQDVEQYWYDLWTMCMHTTLGGRLCVTGKYIVLEQLQSKQPMIESVQPRTIDEAKLHDNGHVPGDRRGAGGLDSAFFAHLKRNWQWQRTDGVLYPSKPIDDQKNKKTTETVKVSNPNNSKEILEMALKRHNVQGTSRTLNIIKKNEIALPPTHELKPKKPRLKPTRVMRKVLPKRVRKRKPFYDDIDKQALKKMAKLRTDWSPIEDHILLLCTIASIYLCPNRRKQIISFSVIRDILHRLVETSGSKTSRACQRRILYTMKNTSTRRSVNMCLEEIRQNTYITERFQNILKRTQSTHQIPESELNINFVELVIYMTKIFSNLVTPEKKQHIIIPDSVKKFKEQFHICLSTKKTNNSYKEPQNIHDINSSVIKTVIHSSMCCSKDKTSWAYQLFKVYQQYPETLLRSVIVKTRQQQMISLKKSYIKSHKTGNVMPLSSSPYQLSISYKYQLLCKYPYSMFQEAYEMIKTTASWLNEIGSNDQIEPSTNAKPIIDGLEIKNPLTGTATGLMEMIERIKIDFRFDIPDEIIVLDQNVQNDSAYERIIKRYYNILKDPSNSWEEKQTSDDEDNFPDFEKDESLKKNLANNSVMNLPGLTTRIAFYMMRAEMCEGIDDKTTQHMHDFFVVNGSKVFITIPNLINTKAHFSIEDLCPDYSYIKYTITPELINSIKNLAIIPKECATEAELIDTLTTKYNANINDIELTKNIISFLDQKEVLGATIKELKTLLPKIYVGNLKLPILLDVLVELRIVLQAGIERIRYIHFDHKKPWIIKSYKILRLDREKMPPITCPTKSSLNDKLFKHKKKNFTYIELQKSKQRLDLTSQQEIKVLLTPWLRIDGSVNRRVLDRWLGSILLACIDQPGITLETIFHKFQFMKPIDIISLVTYLTKLSCIKQSVICKSKTTLFSPIPTITIVPASGLEDAKDIIIEPVCDAVIKLALFIGEKAYSTDFMQT